MAIGNLATWFLAYTPVTQFFILYVWLYRHELSRIFHPSSERKGLKAWADVLTQLGLLKEVAEVRGESKAIPLTTRLLIPTGFISALLSLLVAPALVASNPLVGRFGYAVPFLLQFVPASYAIALTSRRYLGRIPLRPDASPLPKSRRSTHIRHLADKEVA